MLDFIAAPYGDSGYDIHGRGHEAAALCNTTASSRPGFKYILFSRALLQSRLNLVPDSVHSECIARAALQQLDARNDIIDVKYRLQLMHSKHASRHLIVTCIYTLQQVFQASTSLFKPLFLLISLLHPST